jgi:hypothetical protein
MISQPADSPNRMSRISELHDFALHLSITDRSLIVLLLGFVLHKRKRYYRLLGYGLDKRRLFSELLNDWVAYTRLSAKGCAFI